MGFILIFVTVEGEGNKSDTVYQVFNEDSLKINNNLSVVAEIFSQLKQMNGPVGSSSLFVGSLFQYMRTVVD